MLKVFAARTGKLVEALDALVKDLEQRSYLKLGDDKGVVDCGHGVYIRAKDALSAQTAGTPPR